MIAAKERRKFRVVVADDSADLRRMVRVRLETALGVEVVAEAADGRQAVQAIADAAPDLVVLDLAMPHLDGLQVAEQIRKSLGNVVLVALTGYTWDALGEQAELAGFDHFLVKGDSLDELENIIRFHIERGGEVEIDLCDPKDG